MRVIVVDQNADDGLTRVLDAQRDLEIVHLRTEPGVSHARTLGLASARSGIVAWPDDDCTYPRGLLAAVVGAFDADPALDVLVGRIVDPDGTHALFASRDHAMRLDRRSLWPYASAPAFFARREAADRVGDWTTEFGPGTGTWEAGEDSDWLIRAVAAGLDVRYDPALHVLHRDVFAVDSPDARSRARLYGRCTSALAIHHGYGVAFVLRLVARAAGGVVVSLARGRRARAGAYLQSLIGRVEGAGIALSGRSSSRARRGRQA